ncbi:MAG: hypothetical protein HC859_13230 [Bacteroidia bacterium]|nr:hypothetical protein [Bacteroidia bacterium]
MAEVRYLYVPYYHVKDSAVTVSESDYQEYYNENKERFKSEHVRDLNYVSFTVVPSADDSLAVREILEQLKPGLEKSENDSTFAEVNSTNDNPYARYFPSELPPYISNEELQQGKIIGPFLDGGTYKLVKISRIGKDTVYNARASHILITWTDDPDSAVLEANKKAAKERARKLLQELKAGSANFAEKAREINTDASAQKGGDLGWFTSGMMVKTFNDAVFGATRTGLLNDVVETQFGYHIIDITNVKDNTAYWVVTLAEEIAPSDETINATRRQAELFQAEISNAEEFKTKAGSQGLTVMEAKGVQANDRRVGVLGDALVGGFITAVLVAMGSRLAQLNSLLGPVLFIICESAAVLGIALFAFQLGYRQTRHWATWARANDWLRAGLFGAVRLGTFVLGALVLGYAGIHLPQNASISIGDAVISLNPLVNSIAPRIFRCCW